MSFDRETLHAVWQASKPVTSARRLMPPARHHAATPRRGPRLRRRDIRDIAPAPYALLVAIAASIMLLGIMVQSSGWAG